LVSEKIIRTRLERLEEALRRLESKKNVSLDEFLENWEIHSAILREFQVAIEACIDIGTHIISEMGWKSPETYKDVAEILSKHHVISKDFKDVFKKMISFRNIIVHEYLLLDLKTVYENLKKLDDFRKFAKFIEKFLTNQNKKSVKMR